MLMENTKNFFRENSSYEWILSYYVKSDRINRIIRMFFCLHQSNKSCRSCQRIREYNRIHSNKTAYLKAPYGSNSNFRI